MSDPRSIVVLSVVSYWELVIKAQTRKLSVEPDLRSFVESEIKIQRLILLPITADHVHTYATLPLHHRDPFDRMLIAQALHENLTIATKDDRFKTYGVEILW